MQVLNNSNMVSVSNCELCYILINTVLMLHHNFQLISLRVADSQCKTRITKNTEIFLMTVSDQPGLSVKRSILTTIAPTYQPTAKQHLRVYPLFCVKSEFFPEKPGIRAAGISHTLGLCSYQCFSLLVSLPSLSLAL